MTRRFILVLMVGAMMAVLLMMSASPALADHRHDRFNDGGVIFVNDNNNDDDFFDNGFDGRRFSFDNGFGQDFDQEAESGDVDLSFETSNAGDNSNVTAPALQFANTGNLQNEQGFSSFGGGFDNGGFFDDDFFDGGFGSGGDVQFEGASMEFSPSLTTDSDQAVQQSSGASSWW